MWIEIRNGDYSREGNYCHSLRGGCGLKFIYKEYATLSDFVTPCVGVWIEIAFRQIQLLWSSVTPCVGVWIEIIVSGLLWFTRWSLPAWGCGLKYQKGKKFYTRAEVTPCVGGVD